MGYTYNISDVGGETSGGRDVWTATLDLRLSDSETVSGDFNVVLVNNNGNEVDTGEASGGYTSSGLSNPALGTLDFNSTTGEYTFTPDWDAVKATGSDQVVSFVITGRSGNNSDDDTVRITLLICVARGTLIETENGPVAVESLRVGDNVLTLDDGFQPVRWIGSRLVTSAEQCADPGLRPIRVEPEALSPGCPERPLTVSPQHRFHLGSWRAELLFGTAEVLVPAKGLIDGERVRRVDTCAPVEYFHVLFDDHQIIWTDGAPTESFHPGRHALNEMGDAVRNELLTLFPELSDSGGYGETARSVLRPWEAAVLLEGATAEAPR
ncbi:Hint domain-containing protein [Roseovarius sp. SCSIO 43702]|uniref:Hint domain-containing protein n=1 Tax=Roseovarius sp. SCSIO 43702 TaxID=2823043 RepID=UPI001C72B5FE|nr:Hint domain-containing protein [Roseovarius sp. SCSIO 43702]QYX57008.1 Hint domain-containing protein [Roseovarius sp. SCSIO 43702]